MISSRIFLFDFFSSYISLLSSPSSSLPTVCELSLSPTVYASSSPTVYASSKGEGPKALRKVLQAFAVHNREIGYCQSLNFLAGKWYIPYIPYIPYTSYHNTHDHRSQLQPEKLISFTECKILHELIMGF